MTKARKRCALITGAAGGLGSAFALEAARRGWSLVLTDLPASGVQEAGERLARVYRIEVHSLPVDLADRRAREQLVERIRDTGVQVDVLINNAGTGSCASFESSRLGKLAGIVELNVQALIQLTYLLLPLLKSRAPAAILNVASLAAFYPMPSMAVYAATKSFILNFSLAIRHELAGTGVTVSALCPAGMVTNRDSADQVEAQGFFGRITTWYPERVASLAVRQALRGRSVIIPGLANRFLRRIGAMAPRWLVVRLIGDRWRKAATPTDGLPGAPAPCNPAPPLRRFQPCD